MGPLRFLVVLIVVITIINTPGVRCDPSLGFNCVISQDTLRPEIFAWGFEGDPSLGNPFLVWTNVSDTGSGIRNVSVVVEQLYGNSTNYLMDSNGTHYVRTLPGLPENHTYTLFILAFDNANNSATSYSRTIDRHPPPPATVDPAVVMPWVVGSSLGFAVIVLFLSLFYARRREAEVIA